MAEPRCTRSPSYRAPPGRALALAALALSVVTQACNDLLDDTQDLPDAARVTLTGTSPVDLEIITSTSFQVVSDPQLGSTYVQLVLSDTAMTVPPFERDFDIRSSGRFFVRVTNHAAEVADVTLEVFFDGRREYSQAATMSEGGSLEFSQVFRGT